MSVRASHLRSAPTGLCTIGLVSLRVGAGDSIGCQNRPNDLCIFSLSVAGTGRPQAVVNVVDCRLSRPSVAGLTFGVLLVSLSVPVFEAGTAVSLPAREPGRAGVLFLDRDRPSPGTPRELHSVSTVCVDDSLAEAVDSPTDSGTRSG
jgi:hypothetical protein